MRCKPYTLLMVMFLSIVSAPDFAAASVLPDPVSHNEIFAIGPRSLRDAIQLLQQQLGCVITYEDPQYENVATMHQLFLGGPTIPNVHSLHLIYNFHNHNEQHIIQELLDSYSHEDQFVIFDVTQHQGTPTTFDVRPTQVYNQKGQLIAKQPILDKSVSLTHDGTFFQLAEQICKLVSTDALYPPVALVNPDNFSSEQIQVPVAARNTSARSRLDDLLAAYNSKSKGIFTWNLTADPTWSMMHDSETDSSVLFFYSIIPIPDTLRDPVSLSIDSERPLADAVNFLGKRLKQSIIYEDAPWACSCEVLKNRSGQPQAPRGGTFSFTFASADKPTQVLADCVNAYNHQSNPGQFASKELDQALFVYPVQSMKANGETNVIQKPILNYDVSLSVREMPIKQVIQQLCLSLSKSSGQTVVPMASTASPMFPQSVTYNAHKKSASLCLAELAKQLNQDVSWELLYNPQTRQYMLGAAEI